MELPASDIYGFARAPPPTSAEDDSLRRGLDKALYKSQWALATRWLGENRLLVAEGEAALAALLQAGAKAFGLEWALTPTTLSPLLAVALSLRGVRALHVPADCAAMFAARRKVSGLRSR